MAARPNILLLVIDCLRSDRVFGAQRSARTPNIDRLVEQGVGFDTCISVHSFTSVCVTTLLTGLYPFHHGMRAMIGSQLKPGTPTLPKLLRAAGYTNYMEATGPLLKFWRRTFGEFDTFRYRSYTQHLRSLWFDDFRRRLGSGGYRSPWFMYLHVWDLHPPRQVPVRFFPPRYGNTVYDRGVSALDQALGKLLAALPANTLVLLTADHGEMYVTGRLAWLRESVLNEHFARLRMKVPELNRFYEQTRAWLGSRKKPKSARAAQASSRSGGRDWRESAKRGPYGHGWHVYDTLVRVPLVWWWKEGLKPRPPISAQVRQIDIFPTLLDAAGYHAGLQAPIDGESLWEACCGGSIVDRPAIMEACTTIRATPQTLMAALRCPPYKYACRPYADNRNELLFDLQADPGERKNVIAEQPAIADDMRRRFDEIYERPAAIEEPAPEDTGLTAEEQAIIEANLRDLGYIE